MGTVINLRTIRKQKTRETVKAKLAQKTKVSGVKKVEVNRVIGLNNRDARQLDGHKINIED